MSWLSIDENEIADAVRRIFGSGDGTKRDATSKQAILSGAGAGQPDGPQIPPTPVSLDTPAYLTPGWRPNPGPGYAGSVNLDPATHSGGSPDAQIGMSLNSPRPAIPAAGQSNPARPYDMSITHQLEGTGKHSLQPYFLPADKFPGSGATLGHGIDLSWQRASDLRRMNMPESFIEKVRPFLAPEAIAGQKQGRGWTGRDQARQQLKLPTLEQADIDMLQQAVDGRMVSGIRRNYNGANPKVAFDDLDPAHRTALIDMAFNRGAGFGYRKDGLYRDLWNDITAGNWDGVATRLDNDAGSFAARSRQQACILRTGAPCPPAPGKR